MCGRFVGFSGPFGDGGKSEVGRGENKKETSPAPKFVSSL